MWDWPVHGVKVQGDVEDFYTDRRPSIACTEPKKERRVSKWRTGPIQGSKSKAKLGGKRQCRVLKPKWMARTSPWDLVRDWH